MRISPEQYNFVMGEVSPRIYGRTDVYWKGAKELTNMVVFPQGGITKRTGTKYISTAQDSLYPIRLVPFIFSEDQAYVLEFGNQYMRVYKDGGIVTVDGLPYSITTELVNFQPQEMDYAQTADVMYITHPDAGVFKLTRLGHADWTIERVDDVFENGPFNELNDTATTITASAATGSITLSGSDSIFESGHVGSVFKLQGVVMVTATITDGNQWSGPLYIEEPNTTVIATASVLTNTDNGWGTTISGYSKITVQKTYDGGYSYQDVAWFKEDGTVEIAELYGKATYYIGAKVGQIKTADDISVSLRLMKQTGTAKITSVSSDRIASATVIKSLPTLGPTQDWAESAFSTKNGYPRAVCFFEQRLVFGGTNDKPQTIWASKVDDYQNFDTTSTNEDFGYMFTLVSQDINYIQYMVPADILRVFTSGNEWKFGFVDKATTPTSVNAKIQTNSGCARVKPFMVDNSVLFIQKQGKKLLSQTYDYRTETYLTPEISMRAEHMFKVEGGITDVSFQKNPDNLMWLIRYYDGVLICCTYDRLNEITAFTEHTTDGLFESVCVIPGDDRDEVWVSVYRTINGNAVRYIEQLQAMDWTGWDNAVYMDSAIEYAGTTTDILTDADHLEGKEVVIVASGIVLPRQTVVSGTLVLDEEVGHAWVGLPYTSTFESMDLDYNIQGTSTVGKPKRVHKCQIRFLNTNYAKMGREDKEDYIKFRQSTYNISRELFDGVKEIEYPSGFAKSQTVRLISDEPLPLTVLSIAPVISTAL